MKPYLEEQSALFPASEERLEDRQMAGARDGEELSKALYESQHERFDRIHLLSLLLADSRGTRATVSRCSRRFREAKWGGRHPERTESSGRRGIWSAIALGLLNPQPWKLPAST